MLTAYIFILTFSAWLAAYGLLRVAQRLMRMTSAPLRLSEGGFALVCAILFLVVVGAPAAMLVGVILLALHHLVNTRYYLPRLAVRGIPFLAVVMAVGSGTVPAVIGVPQPLIQALMVAILFAIIWLSPRTPSDLAGASIGWLGGLFPTLLAPLWGAPSFLAIDSALIAAALLGALMAAPHHASSGVARAPFALLIGWLMLAPAAHGFLIFSILSMLIYGAALAYARPSFAHGHRHATS